MGELAVMIAKIIFCILGCVVNVINFAVPGFTSVRVIVSNEDSQGYTGYLYIMTMANYFLQLWYNMPFVKANKISFLSTLVISVAAVGATTHLVYTIVFICYANEVKRRCMLGIVTTVGCSLVVFALCSRFVINEGMGRAIWAGSMSAASSIAMSYAFVHQNRDPQRMPLIYTEIFLVGAISWLVYGSLQDDPFIYVPTTIGVIVGLGQWVLWAEQQEGGGGPTVPV